ncbi:chromate transporter [Desulfosporosinus metallidurans]|uniref:Uncharacterized protein n=1 Tax=Desulfosporosinus metallidurans TaxID=1888891 RepID=A0A1Q8QMN0_9FIRM|nr:chromate transporter [Desulfosporosinus metallidurans]OLN28603.1 hypothetical protein DSOL_3981 [Desulfosporosinus metallidurans]
MVLATAALILPSFLIIVLLSGLFLTWEGNHLVRGAMAGLTAGVVGLMLAVVWALVKKFPRRWYYYMSTSCALLASLYLKLNPIWLVLLGGGQERSRYWFKEFVLNQDLETQLTSERM